MKFFIYFPQKGDVVECEVEKIGIIRNQIVWFLFNCKKEKYEINAFRSDLKLLSQFIKLDNNNEALLFQLNLKSKRNK